MHDPDTNLCFIALVPGKEPGYIQGVSIPRRWIGGGS